MSISLRSFGAVDREMIFSWRNDPYIVERSSSQAQVTREAHERWFSRLLTDTESAAFVIEFEGRPIGQLRLDHGQNVVTVSIYLLEPHVGKGWGREALLSGCRMARNRWPDALIIAHVRADNLRGQAGFQRAGFVIAHNSGHSLDGHLTFILHADGEEARTAQQYASLASKHGESYRALNWGSKEGQYLRFKKLAEIDRLDGMRILDVGCGLGDFADWFSANGIALDYVGIDLTAEFLDLARERHPHLKFIHGSILNPQLLVGQRFDYVMASGIFATYAVGAEQWLRSAVSRMWGLADKGVAFNSLSAWAEQKDVGEYHADPLDCLAYCGQLSPWVALLHDYHPRDFTIHLRKGARA